MSRRIDDTSAETFWPGYVDAVTNLVLNLLFVVVIMTVAVFMFAMELGRRQPKQAAETTQVGPLAIVAPTSARKDADALEEKDLTAAEQSLKSQISTLKEQVEALKGKEAQVAALQNKLQTLENETRQRSRLSHPAPEAKTSDAPPAVTEAQKAAGEGKPTPTTDGTSGGASAEPSKVVNATAALRTPERGLEKAVPAGTSGGIVVKFADDAIALSRAETEELRKALAPILGGGAKIEVVVPTGFSEAKRLGFYRVMAVRNQLIELKMPANRIETSVREGSVSADSSRVMVTPR